MVFGTSGRAQIDLPPSTWIDVSGQDADGHWIPAEGKEVDVLIRDLMQIGVAPDEIFLISPFKTVANRLRRIAESVGGIKVGTVHAVQGKEANVVILVLGGNPSQPGAKKWASEFPNLLNVAVSRAKRRLYVVGDRGNWKRYPYFSDCANLI